MFFENRPVDVVKTWVIPILKILADADYQERTWLIESDCWTYSFSIFLEDFFVSLPEDGSYEEFDLDEKTMASLQENIQLLINHPEWIAIQNQAATFLEILKKK